MAGIPVADAREIIYTNEISYKRAVTENSGLKIGGAINHINNKRFERRQWTLNGPLTSVSTEGIDGLFVCEFDLEVMFFTYGLINAGLSGVTEVDLKWQSVPGGARNSIFSTTPKFTPAAPAFTYMKRDLITPANDIAGAGATLPVFSKNTFNEGDALSFDIIQTALSSRTLNVEIMVRPL